jgi:hypothetical protein
MMMMMNAGDDLARFLGGAFRGTGQVQGGEWYVSSAQVRTGSWSMGQTTTEGISILRPG